MSGHRILRASAHKRMPWKNGKGETVEIAVFPADASVDTFDWRISTANVPQSGAFSLFPGIDRTLVVLEGEMQLRVEGIGDFSMTASSDAVHFPGDSPADARVIQPVVDLNVMVRRGRFEAAVFRLDREKVEPDKGERLIFFSGGGTLIDGTELETNSAVHLEANQPLAFQGVPQNAWIVVIRRSTDT